MTEEINHIYVVLKSLFNRKKRETPVEEVKVTEEKADTIIEDNVDISVEEKTETVNVKEQETIVEEKPKTPKESK